MKRLQLFFLTAVVAGFSLASCKSKDKGDKTPATTTSADSPPAATPAPVVVSNDEALKTGLADALKDHPSVKGEVADSTITLTGSIQRSDWQKLIQTLNSLHPKRVNSTNLTIK